MRATKRQYNKHQRKHIPLPDGDELWPRREVAELIGVTERTLVKLPLSVTKIANVCYVAKNATVSEYMDRHTSHPPELTTTAARRAPQLALNLTEAERRKLLTLIEAAPVVGQRGNPHKRNKAPGTR